MLQTTSGFKCQICPFKIVTFVKKDILAHRERMYEHIKINHQDRVDAVENSINSIKSIINANQILNESNTSENRQENISDDNLDSSNIFQQDEDMSIPIDPRSEATPANIANVIEQENPLDEDEDMEDAEPQEVTVLYTCPMCFKKYASTHDLENHIAIFHKIPKKVQRQSMKGGNNTFFIIKQTV